MIRFITFTDDNMTISAERAVKAAGFYGATSTKIYRPSDIDKEFYDKNKSILDEKEGAGLWLWKPYIIMEELNSLPTDAILIYSDAGVEIINDIGLLIGEMDGDILLFEGSNSHFKYCKLSVLKAFGIVEDREQIQASVLVIRNTNTAKEFIMEWLSWCQEEPHLRSEGNHKHDQAILTCLTYQYKVKVIWWSTDYKLTPGDCTIMFKHHRKRNSDYS